MSLSRGCVFDLIFLVFWELVLLFREFHAWYWSWWCWWICFSRSSESLIQRLLLRAVVHQYNTLLRLGDIEMTDFLECELICAYGL